MDDSTLQFVCPHCQGLFQAMALDTPQTVACPHCGQSTVIDPGMASTASPPTTPAATTPAATTVTAWADAGPTTTEATPARRRRRRSGILGWSLVLCCLAAAIAVMVSMGGLEWLASQQQSSNDAADAGANAANRDSSSPRPEVPQPGEQNWTDAQKKSLRMAGFEVRVLRGELGPVRGRDQDHAVQTLASEGLRIALEVRNIDKEASRTYRSWYAQSREGATLADLTDNLGNAYPLLYFRDVTELQGHIAESELVPSQRVHDALIFEIPATVDRGHVTEFHLRLEAAPLQSAGRLQFRIPISMIHNWQ